MSLFGAMLKRPTNATQTQTPVPIVSRAASAFSGWRYNRGATQALGAMEAASVVFGIVDRLATSVSLVDWKLWKTAKSGKPEDREEVTSHLALDILNSPNEFYSRAELMEAAQQHQELTGESWLVVSRNPRARSIPLELWPVRPDRMEPVPSAESYIAGYEYRAPDGECVPLKKDEILFVRRPDPNNPYRGLGPIRSTLTDIDSIRFSMEWNKNFFVNGAEPGGIVEIDRRLSDDEFDELVARWREQHQGTSNAHRVAILEQVKWVDRKYTMRDMQFTELRGVTEAGIKLAFGFPKFALGEVDDVNRAQGEASIAMYAKWLVVPRLERWKGVFNRRFLPMFGTTASGLEFDYVNPVSEDTETENASRTSRVQAVASLVPLGYDPKKALEVFGLPDIPFEKPEPPAPAIVPNGKAPGKKPDPLQALLGVGPVAHLPGKHDQKSHGRRKSPLVKRQDLLRSLARLKPTDVRKLSGGNKAETSLNRYRNGTRVIDKSYATEFMSEKDAADQADAEVLGSLVLNAVTGRGPAAVKIGDDRVFMEFADGKTGAQLYPGNYFFDDPELVQRRLALESSEQGMRLGLADVLMANADRNEGNWLVDDAGVLTGIDHGSAFETRRLPEMNILALEGVTDLEPLYVYDVVGGDNPFAQHLVEMVGDEYVLRDSIDMSAAELDRVGEQLEGLRGQFEALGHTDWHEAMMGRLTDLRQRASLP